MPNKHSLLLRLLTVASALFLTVLPPAPALAQSPTPPSAETPIPTTVANGTRYQPGLWVAAQQKKVEELKGACDLIFIGDSITAAWDGGLWRKLYAPRRALNYGIPGDNIQGALFRLNYEGLKAIHPKVAVILIGTNNGGPAPETAAGILALINKTKALFPGVKIVLMDILPTARRTEHITATNELLRDYADNQTVFRLNLAERMTPEGDSWKGLGPDKLHLTAEGYQIWAEMLEPLLVQFIGPPPAPGTMP